MFSNFDEAKEFIRTHDVRMIDLKYTDLWGRWHHVTLPASQFTPQLFAEGVGFDASSVGLKPLKAGDMAEVINGLGRGKSPNLGKIVTVGKLAGCSYHYGTIRHFTGHGILQLAERPFVGV